jgi:hypothetical protein
MKTAQEVLDETLKIIAAMYRLPEKYGPTPCAFNALLYQIHYLWSYVSDRERELIAVHSELCKSEFPEPKVPEGYFEPWKPDTDAWRLVLQHWKNVDERMGLQLTK